MGDADGRNEGSVHSRYFAAWGRWLVRYRWPLLVLNLLATLAFGYAARGLATDTSYKAMMISGSESARIQDQLEDQFGVDALFMIVIEGDVFSQAYLGQLRKLHDVLAGMDLELPSLGKRDLRDETGRIVVRARDRTDAPERASDDPDFAAFGDAGWGDEAGGSIVDQIVSLINVRDTRYRDGTLTVGGLLDEWPETEAQRQALREHVLAQKSMVGHVVGEAGRHSVILLRTDFMDSDDTARVDAEIRRLSEPFQRDDFRIHYSGVPALTGELNRYLMDDVGRLNVIAFALMMLLLALSFRHVVAVLGPVLVVAQAAVWTVGLMALTDTPMTVVSTIIPSFLVCVGIGDSVHMLSIFRQCKAVHGDARRATIEALAETGRPVLFTTLTTCAGLLSFRLAVLDAIRDFGTFAAFGVMVALLQSLVFLPVLLSFCLRGRFGERAGGVEQTLETRGVYARLLRACDGLSRPLRVGPDGLRPRHGRVLWGGLVFLGVCVAGCLLVEVHHDPLHWLPPDAQGRIAVETLDAHVGGSSDVSLLVVAEEGHDLRELSTMRKLAELEEHVLAYPGRVDGRPMVTVSTGIVDIIRETWWALGGHEPDGYRLPDTQRGLSDTLLMLENAGPDALRRWMTLDAKYALMLVRLRWAEASAAIPMAAHVQAGIDRIMGDGARVYTTGTVYQAVQSDNAIVGDLLRSFGMALALIAVLMGLVLSDVRLALIAMVPNVLPIAAVLAVMGYAGMGLDMSNLMVASIGISIAVDDTIHFLHHFKAHYAGYGDREAAIDHAFRRAGHAIINTSLVLLVGFAVFGLADLGNLREFGLLISIVVGFALAIDLVFTPALLRWAYPAQRPVAGRARAGADVPAPG